MDTRKLTKGFIHNLRMTHKVAMADLINFGGIFALHTPHPLAAAILGIAKYFMFPAAALASFVMTVLAWKRFQLDNGRSPFYKKQTFQVAVTETLAFGAITTAVVLSFLASAAVPIIFTVTLGAKALYHGVAALTYFTKSLFVNIKDEDGIINEEATLKERNRYRLMAKRNAIDFVFGSLFAVGVALMMLTAGTVLPILGIAFGVFTAVTALIYVIKTMPSKRAPAKVIDNQYVEDVLPKNDLQKNPPQIDKKWVPSNVPNLNMKEKLRLVMNGVSSADMVDEFGNSPTSAPSVDKYNIPDITLVDANNNVISNGIIEQYIRPRTPTPSSDNQSNDSQGVKNDGYNSSDALLNDALNSSSASNTPKNSRSSSPSSNPSDGNNNYKIVSPRSVATFSTNNLNLLNALAQENKSKREKLKNSIDNEKIIQSRTGSEADSDSQESDYDNGYQSNDSGYLSP